MQGSCSIIFLFVELEQLMHFKITVRCVGQYIHIIFTTEWMDCIHFMERKLYVSIYYSIAKVIAHHNIYYSSFGFISLTAFLRPAISCKRLPMALRKCSLEISPPYSIGSPESLGGGKGRE